MSSREAAQLPFGTSRLRPPPCLRHAASRSHALCRVPGQSELGMVPHKYLLIADRASLLTSPSAAQGARPPAGLAAPGRPAGIPLPPALHGRGPAGRGRGQRRGAGGGGRRRCVRGRRRRAAPRREVVPRGAGRPVLPPHLLLCGRPHPARLQVSCRLRPAALPLLPSLLSCWSEACCRAGVSRRTVHEDGRSPKAAGPGGPYCAPHWLSQLLGGPGVPPGRYRAPRRLGLLGATAHKRAWRWLRTRHGAPLSWCLYSAGHCRPPTCPQKDSEL